MELVTVLALALVLVLERGESEGAFKKPSSSYPVYLCLVKFRVIDPGFGYRPGDKLIVSPNLGVETELIVNEFGQVTEARVIKRDVVLLIYQKLEPILLQDLMRLSFPSSAHKDCRMLKSKHSLLRKEWVSSMLSIV